MAAWRYKISLLSRIEKYFTSERSEWVNYFSSRLEVYEQIHSSIMITQPYR